MILEGAQAALAIAPLAFAGALIHGVTGFGSALVTGLFAQDGVWITAAATIPAGLAGIYIASRVFRLISREALMRAVGVLLLATGASLLVRGLG
jgi:uncharacterized membrane protein YfcA